MVEHSSNVTDLVRSSFTSKVAVLSTSTAATLIQQFNLNVTQLVQPFAKLTTEVSWQESSGQSISPKDLYLTLVDIGEWKKPEVDAQKNRRLLTNVVTQTPPPLSTTSPNTPSRVDCKAITLTGKSLDYHVNVPGRTTWYEEWRKTFLKLQSDVSGNQHEFLNHFVGCILVISSSEIRSSEDVANVVGKLSKIQQQHQYDHPNTWMLPSVLKYYLILQDIHINENEAEQAHQNFRTMYGGNFCHLLKLGVDKGGPDAEVPVPNPWSLFIEQDSSLLDAVPTDRSDLKIFPDEVEPIVNTDVLHPLSPDCEKPPSILSNGDISNGLANNRAVDRGTSLTVLDVRRIQGVINDFISKALLPYMERQCRNLHESIISRRGMSKSFFSATKRLFGTASKSAPTIVYPTESVEILSRKLGDIYFLFGNYGGAYHLYHQLKKDFYGDAAWLYYSSALELAAISHFMMSQSEPPLAVARAFPVHYVNDAIGHFIDQCRMVDSATRCAIICAECLRQLDNHAESAAIFIRMTSEDCDLRSALMLEQAAYCFLEMNSPRKYALHSVLAGYRYAKAGLKSHSLNSYRQGYQIYNGKGWRYAEDHVNFTIGRLQNALQIPDNITKHLMATLVYPSPQSSNQIQTYYKEFLTTLTTLKQNNSARKPQEFFLPQIKFSEMQVRTAVTNLPIGECENVDSVEENVSTNWDALEESVVREFIKSSVIAFKPTRLVFTRTLDNTVHPTVPCDEHFFIEVPFCNPLKIPLSLRNITLKFDHSNQVEVTSLSYLELEPEITKTLRFSVLSHHVGMITMEAVLYDLELPQTHRVPFQQIVTLKGPRLNNSKEERWGKIYAKDLRNKIIVTHKLPLLEATVEGMPETFFHAQTVNFQIILQDKSNSKTEEMAVSKVIIAAENMENVLQVLPQPIVDNNNSLAIQSSGKNFTQLRCENNAQISKIPCIFKAPQNGESAMLDILILYEIQSAKESLKKSYRVIKISIKTPLSPALHLEYNSLKMLDCSTYLGLLRLYNLTVDYNVVVKRIFFTPSDVKVVDLYSSSSNTKMDSTSSSEIINMNKNESRNMILKFADIENIMKNSELSINVQWEIVNSEGILALGNSRTKIQESVKSVERSFVFQVQHVNTVFADFRNSSVCTCNSELIIHSRVSGSFSIQLESNPPKDDISVATGPSHRASGDVFLTGKTNWKMQVEARKTETVPYSLAVAWPGVYNAAPNIIVTDEERGIKETYSLHSPIIVAQSVSPTSS